VLKPFKNQANIRKKGIKLIGSSVGETENPAAMPKKRRPLARPSLYSGF
jgi:hypothetical protein